MAVSKTRASRIKRQQLAMARSCIFRALSGLTSSRDAADRAHDITAGAQVPEKAQPIGPPIFQRRIVKAVALHPKPDRTAARVELNHQRHRIAWAVQNKIMHVPVRLVRTGPRFHTPALEASL